MTVLFLARQSSGGHITAMRHLLQPLREYAIEAELIDASGFIPDATGPSVDKQVTSELRDIARSFDLVHAIGYRAAWACAEAFGAKEAWTYSAYDIPRTTHRLLITRLNDSQGGVCSSRAVYRQLDEALATQLFTLMPAIPSLESEPISREEARKALGIEADVPLIVGLGRLVSERGFDALIGAFSQVITERPEARLLICGQGPDHEMLLQLAHANDHEGRIDIRSQINSVTTLLAAASIVVVPSRRAGFSMVALEAMRLGTPVMVRNSGGLPEMVDHDVSGFVFESDEDMASQLTEVLGLELTLQTVGHGGKIRALERHRIDRTAKMLSEAFETAICP